MMISSISVSATIMISLHIWQIFSSNRYFFIHFLVLLFVRTFSFNIWLSLSSSTRSRSLDWPFFAILFNLYLLYSAKLANEVSIYLLIHSFHWKNGIPLLLQSLNSLSASACNSINYFCFLWVIICDKRVMWKNSWSASFLVGTRRTDLRGLGSVF